MVAVGVGALVVFNFASLAAVSYLRLRQSEQPPPTIPAGPAVVPAAASTNASAAAPKPNPIFVPALPPTPAPVLPSSSADCSWPSAC